MALFLFLFFPLGFVPALQLKCQLGLCITTFLLPPPFLTISFPTDIILKAVLFVSSEL